jgi:uncharacterized integral membrane protein
MKLSLIAAIILALIMAFFAVQNSQQAQVSFLGWYYDGPLIIVLLLSFTAGAVAAFLAVLPGGLRKSMEIKKLKAGLLESSRKIENLEKTSESLAKKQDEAIPSIKPDETLS